MAEAQSEKPPSLSEQYSLKEKEEKVDILKPSEVKEVENSENAAPAEIVVKNDEPPVEADADKGSNNPPADENNGDASAAAAVEDSETNAAAGEEEISGDQESTDEQPEIKLETAPADFRFPTTNQTRHCFTRYIEYHRCTQAKGEGAPECDKFAKYYRSLCPSEWVEKWNEQRENGCFPGPL
ncbi:cytochrome c oxidase subunit 6b-1-like isoform X1 [Cucurbita maxima]|uniref:Cytochrome c oxidase subunit 6b-1-like isoform X1 n=1 Tax=Cucurbita maxima TaxID=3661 RepID=A0A6J1KAZ5_CUCMA|nr:cytochrome c oxidase subunit 6b-1-like isoform X1 [Cucurbita maxima]